MAKVDLLFKAVQGEAAPAYLSISIPDGCHMQVIPERRSIVSVIQESHLRNQTACNPVLTFVIFSALRS